jgi:hypothetical protein
MSAYDRLEQLGEAQELVRQQDIRIAGLLKLLAKERAKTAAVLSPTSQRITLTLVELERLRGVVAEHQAHPVILPWAREDAAPWADGRQLLNRIESQPRPPMGR